MLEKYLPVVFYTLNTLFLKHIRSKKPFRRSLESVDNKGIKGALREKRANQKTKLIFCLFIHCGRAWGGSHSGTLHYWVFTEDLNQIEVSINVTEQTTKLKRNKLHQSALTEEFKRSSRARKVNNGQWYKKYHLKPLLYLRTRKQQIQ